MPVPTLAAGRTVFSGCSCICACVPKVCRYGGFWTTWEILPNLLS